MKTIQFNSSKIEFLRNYDINNGTDIINMIDMIEDQLSTLLQLVEQVKEPHKSKLLRHVYFISTLQNQISKKINAEMFSALEDLIFDIEEQLAS